MWKQIKRKNKQDTWPEDGNTCKVQREETTQKYKHYIYCVSDEMSMHSKTQHKPEEVQRVHS